MDFEKKLKTRLKISIGYIAIGIIIIIFYLTKISENEYLPVLGTTLVIMGVLRLVQYKEITKNSETIHNQEIIETDERNISIMHKAKSMAFGLYIIIACIFVVTFEVMGKTEYSNVVAINVCLLITIYWICYFIYQKKL